MVLLSESELFDPPPKSVLSLLKGVFLSVSLTSLGDADRPFFFIIFA
jgi:hypothetical protein